MLNPAIYEQIIEWIPDGSRVLDLGSGDGSFLQKLSAQKKIRGEGVERDAELVARSIERGVVVHQGDIMEGLDQYNDNSFDYVLLLGTFQELIAPNLIIEEALNVGRQLIISYTNFAYYKIRFQLLFRGRSPVTVGMPYRWFESPNVRYFSILDFKDYLKSCSMREVQHAYFNDSGKVNLMPNFFAEQGVSLIEEL